MISFKDFLIEVFGSSKIFPWTTINNMDPMIAGFKHGNQRYLVTVHQNRFSDHTSYSVSFGLDEHDDPFRILSSNNTSDTLKIYNTVIDILRVKIKPHIKSGDDIQFESTDVRTRFIYDKLGKMAAKEIDGKYEKGWSGLNFRIIKQ